MTNHDDETEASELPPPDGSPTHGTVPWTESGPTVPAVGMGEIEDLVAGSGDEEFLAHFKIHEEVGRGGMGTVYRALDTLLDRQVAVKVLSDQLSRSPDFQERFIREAKLLARMNHPNIPQIHFIGKARGRFFFAMEWIEGQTVEDIARNGRVPEAEALRIVLQAAEALRVSHQAGIVHRDIKPSNLMVTPESVVKVLDFGIARSRVQPGDAATSGSFEGTPYYASPEQLRGLAVDARSDIYSLGLTCYQLLTGKRPFAETGSPPRPEVRLDAPPPRLPDDIPCSSATRALLERMLATEPDDRFPDCDALLEATRIACPAPPVDAPTAKRALALLADLLLAGIPVAFVLTVFWALEGYYLTTLLYETIGGRIALGLGLFSWFMVYSAFLGGADRTAGQRLQGIRLSRQDGENTDRSTKTRRSVILWGPVCLATALQLDWPPVLVGRPLGPGESISNLCWLLALAWVPLVSVPVLDRRRRSLTDWSSRTRVVLAHADQFRVATAEASRGFGHRLLAGLGSNPRPLLNTANLGVWLAFAIFVGIEIRAALPPNRWRVYDRHTMFETLRRGDPAWDRLAQRFLSEFLSVNQSAANPEVLILERHPFLPLLYAHPEPDLVVEDSSLGTKEWHFGKALRGFAGGKFGYDGGTRNSEEMTAADDAQAWRWGLRRRLVYHGSRAHFVRALLHRRLGEEGFAVLNPESFVGAFRSGSSFILVAWPELRVRVPGSASPQILRLHHGWVRVSSEGGGISGSWGGSWRGGGLPASVLTTYAAEQDRVWGVPTDSIQIVLDLN